MVISPGKVEILKFPVFSCWELETDPKEANHRKTSFAENWGREMISIVHGENLGWEISTDPLEKTKQYCRS